jgi:hypothetical protein
MDPNTWSTLADRRKNRSKLKRKRAVKNRILHRPNDDHTIERKPKKVGAWGRGNGNVRTTTSRYKAVTEAA